jgi:hypothetical protein
MPETMEEFLATVQSEHGGYTALERSLGVAESMDRLRVSLLEEG